MPSKDAAFYVVCRKLMQNLLWQVGPVLIKPVSVRIITWSVPKPQRGIPAPVGGEDAQGLAGVPWQHSGSNRAHPSTEGDLAGIRRG